jgi:hypothetical protein
MLFEHIDYSGTKWSNNGGVHLVDPTSLIVKQLKTIEACKIDLTILLDECLGCVRRIYILIDFSPIFLK